MGLHSPWMHIYLRIAPLSVSVNVIPRVSMLMPLTYSSPENVFATYGRFIEDLVSQEEAGGIDSSKVIVGGFSQGGAIAMMAARSKKKLAGIIGAIASCVLV